MITRYESIELESMGIPESTLKPIWKCSRKIRESREVRKVDG
jgi:hypothetical protein